MSMKSLNSKQVKILIGGLIVFVLIGLFPPWIQYVDLGGSEGSYRKIERPAGYGPIFLPPLPEQSKKILFPFLHEDLLGLIGVRLDIHRLFIQWLILIALTSCILLLFHKNHGRE